VSVAPGVLPAQYLLVAQVETHRLLNAAGVDSMEWADPIRGRIYVRVLPGDTPRAQAVLPAELTELVDWSEGELGDNLVNKNDNQGFDLLDGGLSLTTSAGGAHYCTSGFAVQIGGSRYLATAEHCMGYPNLGVYLGGASWYQAGIYVGGVAGYTPNLDHTCPGYCMDVMLLGTPLSRASFGRVFNSSADPVRSVTSMSSTPAPGAGVCNTGGASTGMSGNSSPKKCGTVYNSGSCDEWGCGFPAANFYGCHGDSGAAIWSPSGSNAKAEGILHGSQWGSGTCGFNVSYTWLPLATAYFGASLTAP
jgi:hypothetical protein